MSLSEHSLLNGHIKLLQSKSGFRAGLDTVFVAAAVQAKTGQTVLDLGAGAGGVSLCVVHRCGGALVTGVELQPEYYDLAQKNVELNSMQDHVNMIQSDIRNFKLQDKQKGYDHVVCNPPYMKQGSYLVSPDAVRAKAMGETGEASLMDWIDCAYRCLKPGGGFTMIQRADLLDHIIAALVPRFGAIEIIPLWPRAGEPAKRIIIRCNKDRKTPSIMHAGIVLHEGAEYSPVADKILRDGMAIDDVING